MEVVEGAEEDVEKLELNGCDVADVDAKVYDAFGTLEEKWEQ
jgi:hypothetical protein